MKSKLRRKLFSLATGLLVGLLGSEVLVRMCFGAPIPERYPQVRYVPQARRGFSLVPGDRSYTYHHPVRVNSHGLRGPEIAAKDPHEFRVFLLGDSLTFGHGVAEEDTIGAHLERELGERAPLVGGSYRVINGGHQGFATHQEVDMLHELGETLQPDLVLLLWLWNDVQEKPAPPPPAGFVPPPAIEEPLSAPLSWTLRQVLRKSALLLWLNDLRFDAGFPGPDRIERALDRVGPHLLRFREEIERLGARAAFVVLPDAKGLVIPNPTAPIDARAADVARAHDLDVLLVEDEVRTLIEERGRLPVLAFDGHYDGEGNRAIAAGIARGLLETDLVRAR